MNITKVDVAGYKIGVRWNRYLGAPVVDITHRSHVILSGRPLRAGNQSITEGISAKVTPPSPNRYSGDLIDADIHFYRECK